jgi:CheY-like chemotaxis protein
MTSRHTILYAEDDLDDLFMIKKAFEIHDHIQVMHASNGEEALHHLFEMHNDDVKPCLIILDINMPILNGREALTKIKNIEEFKEIPVILFSTSSSFVDKQFAEKYQVDLITKPLHYHDLEKIAHQFVNKCNFEINKIRTPH